MTNLWKYNKVTGYWNHERKCDSATAKDWLIVYQKDEPEETFKLSKNKPTKRP